MAKKKRRSIDFDTAKEKQKELADRTGNNYHELKQGWNTFYICPPWNDDARVPWKEVQQHGFRLVCPKYSGYDSDCAICKERRKRLKKGDSEFADNFRLQSRGYLNAIRKEDIKSKDVSAVKLLGVAGSVLTEIVDHVTDERVDICDPKAAVFVSIKRKGKGQGTRYPSIKFGEPVNIDKYITDEIIDAVLDLDVIKGAQPASIKDQTAAIRKFVRGGADEDEDSFDDDEDFESEELEDDAEEDELFDDPDDSDDDLDEDDLDEDLDDDLDEDDDDEEEEQSKKVRKASKKGKVRKAPKKGNKRK
jgi:hypothetical protein